MQDVEAVESIIAGNSGGLAEAYDEYADFVYAYCRSMLGDPKDTAETVLATFVVAAARADGLQDRERLRAWLFAIARNLCLRGRGGAGHIQAPGSRAPQADIEIGTEAERQLLRTAIDGLNPPEHDIVSLLWYGLDIDDVTLVLGIPRNQVYTVFSRARDQLEASVAALLVGRHGRDDCHALDSLLGDWNGSLDFRLRARITRHIGNCGTCMARRERELRPALQLSLSPGALLSAAEEARASIPPAPRRLRDRLIWLVTAYDPEASDERAAMEKRAGAFGNTGFPKPLTAGGGRRRGPWLAGGAAIAVAAAVVAVIAISAAGGTPPAPSAAANSPGTTSGASAATASQAKSPSASASGTPSSAVAPVVERHSLAPSATRRAGAKTSPASTSPSATASSPGPATTSASPPPTAPSGTVSVSSSSITVSALFSATLTLTASGAAVHWSASLPSSVSGKLSVSPSSGTLQAGQSVSLTVTSNTASSFKTTLTVNPGAHAIAVTVGFG
ncbi:MAG TPA: sigma-70 family RNA polymerase sigma factor [Trebonia sp.]|jgi:RNA polymerase sigma factor (sigma-70 family)|nr:sigma-70 family RNA polymerase sigma factor [Trebonia sp.]